MEIIEKYREEYRAWCEKINISTIKDVNEIADSKNVNKLINICEARHSQKLSEIALRISEGKKRVVFIAGPSSSGKTTSAMRLQLHLRAMGLHAVPVSLDDYYLDKSLMPKNEEGEPDYEALDSIDYRLFNKNIADLTDGRETVLPAYDFKQSRIIHDARILKLNENDVIIAEGLHALNPLIGDNIADYEKFRVYCTPLSVLKDMTGRRIGSHTIRMTRRLIRDYYFRNSDYKMTFSLWPNQERAAEKNIFPYTESADVVFNTALLYEFGVYKKHLTEVLLPAPEDDKNIDEILRLRELAVSFAPISADMVPHISLIREFVGGSTL